MRKLVYLAATMAFVSTSAYARVTGLSDSRAKIQVALQALDSLVLQSAVIKKVTVKADRVKIELEGEGQACFATEIILKNTSPVIPVYVADGHQRSTCD